MRAPEGGEWRQVPGYPALFATAEGQFAEVEGEDLVYLVRQAPRGRQSRRVAEYVTPLVGGVRKRRSVPALLLRTFGKEPADPT